MVVEANEDEYESINAYLRMSDDSYNPELDDSLFLKDEPLSDGCSSPSTKKERRPIAKTDNGYDLYSSNDVLSNLPSIPMNPTTVTGIRRQKSLQFVTTEMIFLIMRQEKINGITNVNPSIVAYDLHITRRRIYDIIHVFDCLKLVTRVSYRDYGWNGMRIMQQYLTELYEIHFDKFEEYCINQINNNTQVEHKRDKIEKGTTKHITIICLKYLFLYIKSGRTVFNNQDLASFVLKESHISNYINKDREKSIERRLYDIISVLCGLGLIKRKADAIEWSLTAKDIEANEQLQHVSYSKGMNMMIQIECYLLHPINGIPETEPNMIESLWDHLFQVFQSNRLILAIDLSYLLHQTIQSPPGMMFNTITMPGSPNETKLTIEVPGRKSTRSFQMDPAIQKEILQPSITQLMNTKEVKEKKTKGTRRKHNKQNSKGKDEDEDWLRYPKRRKATRPKPKEVDLFNEHDLSWKENTIPIPTEIPCVQVETPSRNIIPAFAFSPQSSSLQSLLPSPLPSIPLQLPSPPSRNPLFQIFSPTHYTDFSSSIAIPHLHFLFSPTVERNDIADEFQLPEFSEDAIPPLPALPVLPEIPTVQTVDNTDMTTIRKDVFVSPSNVLQSSVSSKKEKE